MPQARSIETVGHWRENGCATRKRGSQATRASLNYELHSSVMFPAQNINFVSTFVAAAKVNPIVSLHLFVAQQLGSDISNPHMEQHVQPVANTSCAWFGYLFC